MSKTENRWASVVFIGFVSVFALLASSTRLSAEDKPAGKKSAADLEKEKALQNPYSNDLGPGEIDAVVKEYPAKFQEGYKLLKTRCAQCHQPNRPLNSRFVEPYVDEKDKAKAKVARAAVIAQWKKDQPELFDPKNNAVWQIEEDTWNRYVHRMMNKPGCGVRAGGHMTDDEAKKIWEFLVYDSSQRKVGKNAAAWKAHREDLLKQFKEKYPKRYEELDKASPRDL